MSPRLLPTNIDDRWMTLPTNPPSLAEFGPVILFVFVKYRDPKMRPQNCKPSSKQCSLKSDWSYLWLVGKLGLGCSLAENGPL